MTILKAALFSLLAVWATFYASGASAFEGMTTGPEHSSIKQIIQTDYVTSPRLDSAVATLRRLIAINEAQFGKTSRQVGILLSDIGEAAFKQANFLNGAEKEEKLKRAVNSLVAGADMLKPYQNEHDAYIIQRARAYRFAGMAYLQVGDRKSAESVLRNGLAIHWKRFNDNAYQLEFFPFLFDAVDGPDAKRKVAEAEIKIARNVYHIMEGSGHASLEGPMKRLRMAETDGNPLIAQFEAARVTASELAAKGDDQGAYGELARVFELASNESNRRLFTGRLKPSPFFIYEDPDAGSRVGWDGFQGALKMDAYDNVATRFLVDHDLKPFIAEGRNNLMALLAQWEGLYNTGDHAKAAYFCRLIPPNYSNYEDGPLPKFCANNVQWAGWMRMQGNVGQGVRYLEMGITLLPTQSEQSEAERTAMVYNLRAMASSEAYYGSPDSFLTAYERLIGIDKDPPAELAFYEAIIRDDPSAFQRALSGLGTLVQKQGEDEEGPGPRSKLAIVGPKVAQAICASQPKELPAVVSVSFCSGETGDTSAALTALAADIKAGGGGPASPDVSRRFLTPDWRLLKLVEQPSNASMRASAVVMFAPGQIASFQKRELSKREKKFLASPQTYDDYVKATPFEKTIDDQLSDDFDAALLSTALYEAGKLDMAKSWASAGIERYQSASPPQTIFSLWMSENYEEETYVDGWRWLLNDQPLLAVAAFTNHIPKTLAYSRGGVGLETQSTLDWERVLGSYHGRMIATEKLGDMAAARQDARAVVAYLRFALGLQSFSRNETREVIVRVARPALQKALDILTAEKKLSPDDLEAVFQIAQMMKPSGTGATVARLGARLAAVSPELASLAKQREELRQKWLLMSPELQDERKALALKVDELDVTLARDFPRYVEISGTVAVSVEDTRKTLLKSEALIAFLDTGDNYLAIAIAPDMTTAVRTLMSSSAIDGLVRDLRRGLELRGGRVPAFRSEAAFELYTQLFAPIEATLPSKPEHLILIPDGSLESIPFAVLVTEQPASDDLATTKWFSDKYMITRVPSVASLTMLRENSGAKAGDQPFLGVGDPLLDGDPDMERGGLTAAKLVSVRGGTGVEDIRALPRLPETADELKALQKTLKAPDGSLLLGAEATETMLKAEKLSQFKTVAFATHGLLAGEIDNHEEAGLIMTPPAVGSSLDDGYLSASEVAELNLNADVVLLSACNTAAPEQVGAEGLSGLAKAFFFAGARNLVVSHWAVDSVSAAALTTAMFENQAKAGGSSYAAALREAMRQVRQTSGGKYAHPLYWGPFEVVGAN